MKPSIGRILIVPMDPAKNNGSSEAPAVITRVWSDTRVNLRVLADNTGDPEWRTSVELVDEPGTGFVAWWPPRV